MKTILLATDFSDAAMHAARYATDMAKAIKADLVLLHVSEQAVPYSELPIPFDPEALTKEAEREITFLKDELSIYASGNVAIRSEVRIGSFFADLQTVCDEVRPYIVIMGSQGKTAAERLFYGSHAVYAMKHLHWPLLTVPPNATFSSIKKICIASDLHKVADTIPVAEVKTMLTEFNAELHILNIGELEIFDADIVYESGVLKRLLGNIQPTYHFMNKTNPDKDIIKFCQHNEIDLLIVFPKRHSLVDKLIHRGHTRGLVLHSPVPVLALHK